MNKSQEKKALKILSKLPLDEQTAIAYGFYNFDDTYVNRVTEEKFDGFWGFKNDEEDDTPDSTTSIDGRFGRPDRFEQRNFDNADREFGFDNFSLNKARRGIKKTFKKVKKGIKKAASKVKKGLKKLSIKNIVKTVKKAVKDVGTFIKKGALFIPRQAARGLLALNYRGFAEKLAWAKKNDKKKKKKLDDKWGSLGGKNSALWGAVRSGQNKKALFCWAKCKEKLRKATAKKKKKGFDGADGGYELDNAKLMALVRDEKDWHNAVVTTGTAVMVGLGGSVIAALGGYLASVPQSKALKEQTKNAKIRDDKELKLMADQQGITKEEKKKELQLMEMKVKDSLDPVNQILNNPKLTQEEKKLAIVEVEKALSTKSAREGTKSRKKYLILGGIGLAVVVVLAMILKKK